MTVARAEQKKWKKYYSIDFLKGIGESERTFKKIQSEEIALKTSRKEEKKARWLSAMTGGMVTRPDTDATEVYELPERAFFAAIKDLQDDLGHQVQTQQHHLDEWFREYDHPPPHTAMRIAIILSKARLFKEELRFLRLYDKHFGHFPGSRTDQLLGERLIKKEAQNSHLLSN